jgi:secreted PhoX family phosphatase
MADDARRTALPIVGAAHHAKLTTCRWRCGSQCFHDPPNTSPNPTFEDVLSAAVSRRDFLTWGVAAALVASPLGRGARRGISSAGGAVRGPGLSFAPIALSTRDEVIVPEGYGHAVVIRWGDPLSSSAPALDPTTQTPQDQASQFGYNCDFVMLVPLPAGSNVSHRGLLWVNHEYTNPEIMFPSYDDTAPTARQVGIEIAAHGGSIVEVRRQRDGSWAYLADAPQNRRITAETPMELTGPAAGHDWLKTEADPDGVSVLGMLNNCAGGVTPWGTILTAEENFHQYFANLSALDADDPRRAAHARFGIPEGESDRKWERFVERFDVGEHPNEPFRFGWVVEIDPYDPTFVPRKRTALGRIKHEGATTRLTADRRVAAYMGDDERFEYLYKFVTADHYQPGRRRQNLGLLDDGTLYVAAFASDGTGEWKPLTAGTGPLTPANGFEDQGDVLINARFAADAVGATKMDRPEDVEPNPVTGVVYACLTNNTRRIEPNAPNPRPDNRYGHVIEILEEDGDAGATRFRWRIFLLCGDPDDPSTFFAGFPKDLVSPIANPDNVTFDRHGNLWIATDGQPSTFRKNDAIFAVPTEGEQRGFVQQFLSAPVEAEVCGPLITADQRTLFCAIQHPGEGGTFQDPLSNWPDGDQPPRPSVISVWRTGRGAPHIGV